MDPLWRPSEEKINNANLTRFIDFVNTKYGLKISDFESLYQWSIDQREDFWSSIWDFGDVIASKPYDKVLEDSPTMIGAQWFHRIATQLCGKPLEVQRRQRSSGFQGRRSGNGPNDLCRVCTTK